MILSGISKIDLPFVFKGGTSLSKAYNLIDRFSEDIDLSMNRKPSDAEKRRSKDCIIQIAEELGMMKLRLLNMHTCSVLPSVPAMIRRLIPRQMKATMQLQFLHRLKGPAENHRWLVLTAEL